MTTTVTSRLQRTINDFKQRLLANEAQAAAAMETAHANTLAIIEPQLQKLYDGMMEYLGKGEKVPAWWLYEANRLETIKRLISSQIDQFGALAATMTGRLQEDGARLGLDASLEMLKVQVPSGVSWSFGVPSMEAIRQLVGATQAGSPLADLFRGFGQEAADAAGKALITGVTLGQNPREFAPQVRQALDVSRHRALTISRTESLRAYRNASLETYRANSDVVMKYRRTAAKNSRTCIACIALDGKLYDVDTEFAIHPNDRCTAVPITKDWSEILGPLGIDTSNIPDTRPQIETGEAWFNRQPETTQREVLGNRGYELWKASNGKITLQDFVLHKHDKDWGSSVHVRPLKDLEKAAEERVKRETELKAREATRKKASRFKDGLAGMGIKEKEKFLAKNGGDQWVDDISVSEYKAIQAYTGAGYKAMNKALRTGGKITKQIKDAQSALLKSKAPVNMIVTRGYGNDPALIEQFKIAAKTGGVFQEKGFVSTTLKETAQYDGFQVRIRVAKGAPGAYVDPISNIAGEKEFLLPHGAKFKVLSGKQDKNGEWSFEVEYKGID